MAIEYSRDEVADGVRVEAELRSSQMSDGASSAGHLGAQAVVVLVEVETIVVQNAEIHIRVLVGDRLLLESQRREQGRVDVV